MAGDVDAKDRVPPDARGVFGVFPCKMRHGVRVCGLLGCGAGWEACPTLGLQGGVWGLLIGDVAFVSCGLAEVYCDSGLYVPDPHTLELLSVALRRRRFPVPRDKLGANGAISGAAAARPSGRSSDRGDTRSGPFRKKHSPGLLRSTRLFAPAARPGRPGTPSSSPNSPMRASRALWPIVEPLETTCCESTHSTSFPPAAVRTQVSRFHIRSAELFADEWACLTRDLLRVASVVCRCSADELLKRGAGDAQHVAAENLPDVFVRVAPLDQADREQRPVGPGQCFASIRSHARRRLQGVVRPERSEFRAPPRQGR